MPRRVVRGRTHPLDRGSGRGLALVAAGRDVLRVVSAQEGSDHEGDLGPVIEEVDDFSQLLGEVRTDGLPASRGMKHEVCANAVAPDHFVTGRIDRLVEESVATGACDTREAAREAWGGASRRVGPRHRACS